jgi:selenocysteine lyase/cysteine desulfurase
LQDRLWVTIASADWRRYERKAYRFSNFGTSNLSVMVGLKAALDFHQMIGPERIYGRIHQLAGRVREHVQTKAQFRLANASADPFYAGLVSFEPVKGNLKRVVEECAARKIRIASSAERIRIATHIFTQPRELQAFFEALDRGA